jgi:hypothetical protein
MNDRAVIPLAVAGAAGFLAGLIASALQIGLLALGIAGAVSCAVVGAATLSHCRASEAERDEVALIRATGSALLFLAVYVAITAFLRDGSLLVMLIALAVAAYLALALARVTARRTPGRTA